MTIRLALGHELPELQAIELAAGELFRPLGMVRIADDEPPATETLEEFRQAGRAWVHTGDGDHPLAYLLGEPLDGALHIEQVTVLPTASRRGLGRQLIDHAEEFAIRSGLTALTLTTFTDVPWNAPYYERLGFRPLPEDALTPGLIAVRTHETELGLDAWPRVCMHRPAGLRPTAERR
ncbi:Acetyltransferase (GNAT) family protein [Streptomyces sp. YIM 130001]|uniref:GNAT family N-acetyltransferase n=1 Tax=Streptomyces sp. YIM 130001 TaxID=2259644 RepID=UPI000EB92F4E|nr:GNAT family N-acetyltransferase [Streptomyces sp. YIM 130001]RII08081.1 Acetyltransferase (GNAT) family protein [Streptomyces sp. YIM 130001]